MKPDLLEKLPAFLEVLNLPEEPMGVFYTDDEPDKGFTPPCQLLPDREMEKAGQVDWRGLGDNFSCVMGNIWRARRKKQAAWFSAERFGCLGGAFWLGFMPEQLEGIIHYVSIGVPGQMEGEHYCASPETVRQAFKAADPRPAPKKFCVFKPLSLFTPGEEPELVVFFVRPESLCGLHQLSTYVTDDPEIVASPWSAACGSLAVWPLKYMAEGKPRAVLGAWDPSARKFYKTDELTFTIPLAIFEDMLGKYENSFLMTKTWDTVRRKAERSRDLWKD